MVEGDVVGKENHAFSFTGGLDATAADVHVPWGTGVAVAAAAAAVVWRTCFGPVSGMEFSEQFLEMRGELVQRFFPVPGLPRMEHVHTYKRFGRTRRKRGGI